MLVPESIKHLHFMMQLHALHGCRCEYCRVPASESVAANSLHYERIFFNAENLINQDIPDNQRQISISYNGPFVIVTVEYENFVEFFTFLPSEV